MPAASALDQTALVSRAVAVQPAEGERHGGVPQRPA
jgi:hypothetical protein